MQEAIDLTIHPLLAWLEAHLRAPQQVWAGTHRALYPWRCRRRLQQRGLPQADQGQADFQAWLRRQEGAGLLTFQLKS